MPPDPRVEYSDELDDEAGNWIRVRLWIEQGVVQGFAVQYETTVDGQRMPVVRYDTAHDAPHCDRLNRRGKVIAKEWLPEDLSLKEALAHAERDVRDNWRSYRRRFLRMKP